jgi:hypothetical protein
VSAYEPPLGKPAGGYPIGTLHTGDDERAATESALRDAVSKELGDQADLRVSEGLAGHVIVETARQTHAQLIVLAASPGKPMLPGTVSQYVLSRPIARSCSCRAAARLPSRPTSRREMSPDDRHRREAAAAADSQHDPGPAGPAALDAVPHPAGPRPGHRLDPRRPFRHHRQLGEQ